MSWLVEEMKNRREDRRFVHLPSKTGIVTRIFSYPEAFKEDEKASIYFVVDGEPAPGVLPSMRWFVEEEVRQGAQGLILGAELLLPASTSPAGDSFPSQMVLLIQGACPAGECSILYDIIRDEDGTIVDYRENPQLQNTTVARHLFDNLTWSLEEKARSRGTIISVGSKPTVCIEKPSLPTLWLDTSVGINLAKDQLAPPYGQLRDTVVKLVQEGKLLCPEADQREEYEGRRLDKAATQIFDGLSEGIRLRHRQEVIFTHTRLAMKAFVEQAATFTLPVDTYFGQDPVREQVRLKKEAFRVDVRLQPSNELLQREKITKTEGQDELEKLRLRLVARGQTYKQQLAIEQDGQAEAMLEMVRRFNARVQQGSLGFWDENYLIYQRVWETTGGKPSGLEGLCNFFRSSYYRNLPDAKIASQLYADILTAKQREVRPSDSMDIRLLSVAIPVAHYVFTDKDMENRIKNRKIDQEWGTQVFSVRTVKDLLTQLENLS